MKLVAGKTFKHKGFSLEASVTDNRLRFSRIKAPKGTKITDKGLERALQSVSDLPEVRTARFAQSGDMLVVPKRFRSINKAIRVLEALVDRVCLAIINSLITESKKAKDKVRRANATQRQKPGYLNSKSRKVPPPVPVPVT